MKIRDVMTPKIDVVFPEDTLTTAAQLMADLDFEALPVRDVQRGEAFPDPSLSPLPVVPTYSGSRYAL